LFLTASLYCHDGLNVTPLGGTSPANLAATLVGPGVTVSNVTYSTGTNTSGFFTGGTGIIGFESGIILSTGLASCVAAVNSNINCDNHMGLPGDPDLTALAGMNTYDATDLEFDFIPTDSTLYLQYVFASEEYNQWVSQYNDVFAFYLDGVNTATLPSGVFVSVNNVNACTNAEYYVNNINQSTGLCPAMPPSANLATAMNGMTKVMSIVRPVTPNVKHHMKLVIADVKDDWLDSNVFVAMGSLQSNGTPTPTFTPTITFTPTLTPTFTPTPTPYPDIHVWPNPFDPGAAVRGTVKCENMRDGSSLVIYTLSGEKVAEVLESNGYAEWDAKTKGGKTVAPGIYYYLVRRDTEVFAKGVWIVRYRQ
jgi:hypothetical protein